MSPEQREQVRLSILRHLARNPTQWGFNVALIRQLLAAEGQLLEASEIEAELLYLEDKGLVARPQKIISPELRAWRITATGRDYLAERHIE
jgi:hypothetical protein